MEDHHQEFEKPIFVFVPNKLRNSRVSRNRKMKNGFRESMSHYEELSCYYGLRKNPKKIQKSLLVQPRRNKKSLIRCKECGKGFLYEKCLLNHRLVTHSEESVVRTSLLCSFSVVQKRKRSKRVSRYKKKSTRFSVSSSSSSFTMFPVSVDDDGELLEVAESLILLSMSGGKFLNVLELFGKALDSNQRESGYGFLRNEQKLVAEEDRVVSNEQKKLLGISTESDGTWKELSDFLADKKVREDDESGQQKQVGGAGMLREATEQKLVRQETTFEDSNSGNKSLQMNIDEHRCGLCDKVFSTYQALGGHQTFHRIRNKSKSQTKSCRDESVEVGS
ncbi:PREDICTED: uncharacterized protein LOC104720349 [Camelina sativa]|uniref:Uncharacterized protein LOC104720349 n=1 Tax=Camelina sativa TaxID=90675 RepID=A0ABM0U6S0_CAMSA|nr:PREDICTED: uncharacterized protein LOC104720349 [Camelina sativa]